MLLIALLLPSVVLAAFPLWNSETWPLTLVVMPWANQDSDVVEFPGPGPDIPPEDPDFRLITSTSGPQATVTCWPSKGGFYVLKDCYFVQRSFPGFDRFTSNITRPDITALEEDVFCDQIRKLGAQWWSSTQEHVEHLVAYHPPSERDVLHVGWPDSGGVWALQTNMATQSHRGLGIIHYSQTMDEYCEMIKTWGGTFFEEPKDCPFLDLS